MVLLWLWLSEQQCKRSRDFWARSDLPDTTLTFCLAASESNRYFATPHSLRNDEGTSAEILYWWRVATQNWVVLLIGWSQFSTNQVLGSDTSSLISMEFLRLFLRDYFAGKAVVASRTVACLLKLRFSLFPRKPTFPDSNTIFVDLVPRFCKKGANSRDHEAILVCMFCFFQFRPSDVLRGICLLPFYESCKYRHADARAFTIFT